MHRVLVGIYIFLFTAGFAYTQQDERMWVGVAPGPVFPGGAFGNAYRMGIGAKLSFRYVVLPALGPGALAVGGNTGFYTFGSQQQNQGSVDAIPLMGAAEYFYRINDFRVYAGLEMGLYFANLNQGSFRGQNTDFGLSPFAGFRYEIAQRLDLDVSVHAALLFNGNSTTAATDPTTGRNVSWNFVPVFIGVAFRLGE